MQPVTQAAVTTAAKAATFAQCGLMALAATLGSWGGVAVLAPLAAFCGVQWALENRRQTNQTKKETGR